jgi:hypothetical protein
MMSMKGTSALDFDPLVPAAGIGDGLDDVLAGCP